MTIAMTLIACWYGMMLTHELGHVLAAVATGSRIDAVRVPLFGLSQTEIATYKHPVAVIAMGPVVGVVPPLIAWAALVRRQARVGRPGRAPLTKFFAGFCLVANGGYLASALVLPVGDVADLMALGVSANLLGGAGVAMAGAGLWMWNGLGAAFGLARGASAEHDPTLAKRSILAATFALACVGAIALVGSIAR